MKYPFYLLIIPAVVISALVFFVFSALALWSISDQIDAGSASFETWVFVIAYIFAASAPLIVSLAILISGLTGKRFGVFSTVLMWTVILVVGLIGLYVAIVDPGDAIWAGVPPMAVSALLAFSLQILRSE